MIYSYYKIKSSVYSEVSRSMQIEDWITSIFNCKTKDRDKERERKQHQIVKFPKTKLISNFGYLKDNKVIIDIIFQPTY